ncbi:hypothetical protein [Roseivivax sp. CAU 1761]
MKISVLQIQDRIDVRRSDAECFIAVGYRVVSAAQEDDRASVAAHERDVVLFLEALHRGSSLLQRLALHSLELLADCREVDAETAGFRQCFR